MLEPYGHIVQSWRTIHFEPSDGNWSIEVRFEKVEGGTKVTLRHTNLPPHGTRYESGWMAHYFKPMKKHFGQWT